MDGREEKTVRRLLPTDADGGIDLTAIADAVGRGAFADGDYDLSAVLASGSRYAAYLASWWPDAQSYASGMIGQELSSGALAKDVEQAGMGLSNPRRPRPTCSRPTSSARSPRPTPAGPARRARRTSAVPSTCDVSGRSSDGTVDPHGDHPITACATDRPA